MIGVPSSSWPSLSLSPPLINNNNCRHLFVVTVVVVVSAVNTVLASLKPLVDTHAS